MIPVFQEGYVPPGQGQELAQHLEALITYDGVHLFDVRNIHVDHTISDLAEMVKRTIEKSLREQDDPSFNG
jgi:hypothetical protein